MPDLSWLKARPIAHRGYHDRGTGRIENTESAFAAAIEHDFAIECDVQLTGDGKVVVFHDAELDHLTVETGPVNARTAAELALVELRDTKDRIQTLPELMEQVDGKVPLVVEIKSDRSRDPAISHRVAEFAQTYNGPIAAMSFDPILVRALRSHGSDIVHGIVAQRHYRYPIGSDLTAWQQFQLRHLLHFPATQPKFIAYNVKHLPEFAPMALNRIFGLPLLCWTTKDADDRKTVAHYADQMIFEGFDPDLV